jgi:histidinol-phosphate aminotransferase
MSNRGLANLPHDQFHRLHLNEGFPELPKNVSRMIREYARFAGCHRYPPESDRSAVLESYRTYCRRIGQAIEASNIGIFHGSDALLEKILLCVSRKATFAFGQVQSDAILVVGPTYRQVSSLAYTHGLKVWDVRAGNAPFTPEYDGICEALKRKSPALCYICNPNNPTGYCMPREEIKKLIERFPSTLFVVDEAYLEFGGRSVASLATTSKNLIVSRTLSKAFGLADMRVGFGISHTENIAILDRANNDKDVSRLALAVAQVALQDTHYVERYSEIVRKNHEALVAFLRTAQITPIAGAGNFVSFVVPPAKTNQFLVHMAEHGVLVRDLSALVPGLIRVTVVADLDANQDFKRAFLVDLSQSDSQLRWLDFVEKNPYSFWPKRYPLKAV